MILDDVRRLFLFMAEVPCWAQVPTIGCAAGALGLAHGITGTKGPPWDIVGTVGGDSNMWWDNL